VKTLSPEEQAQLTAFHKDFRDAEARAAQAEMAVQMAQQTLVGARADHLAKEARFKGAAEFVFGTTEIAFDYDDKSGKLSFRPASVPPPHGPGKRGRKKR
jgi:hypothetical protein